MTNDRHGEPARSYSRGCRCEVCRAKHAARLRGQRDTRKAERVLVDGRLVAVHAPRHGLPDTYNNWFCRCEECTKAWAKTHARQDAARRERRHGDQQ